MKLELPANLYSPTQLEELVYQIRRYSGLVTDAAAKSRAGTGDKGAALELYNQITTTLFGAPPPNQIDAAAWDAIAAELETIQKRSRVVHMTLAGWPTEKLKTKLVAWLRQNIDPTLLVNFGLDRSIIGGMVVRTDSHIHDWSYRSKILEKRDRLAELLHNV